MTWEEYQKSRTSYQEAHGRPGKKYSSAGVDKQSKGAALADSTPSAYCLKVSADDAVAKLHKLGDVTLLIISYASYASSLGTDRVHVGLKHGVISVANVTILCCIWRTPQ